MHQRLAIITVVAAATFAACGGGGGSSAPPSVPQTPPTSAPTAAPQAQGNLPLSESIAGTAGWADPTSHRTLYFLDVDTPAGGTCTGSCLSVWPVFAPTSGAQASGNMTIVTRSDGTGRQWAYQGHPLYTFSGDSGPDQANGDNFPDFGGHWHVARPVAATPAPGGSPPACVGVYC